MPARFRIPQSIYEAMLAHAQAELPAECCGVLCGLDRVTQRYALVNELASPIAFRSEPASMLRAVKAMRTTGTEILAVYHSHPTSPAIPSVHDLADRYSDDTLTVILGRDVPNSWTLRVWSLTAERATEQAWEIA